MIQNVANIFRIEELRRRILITVGLLAIYRLGFHVPLPGVSMQALADRASGGQGGDLLGLINVISGGGILSLAVFSSHA